MVIFTDKAIEKFREFLGRGNTHGIRIFVITGG
jgi:Fe-S cluster assembly iron-binding protein IscA